MVFLVFCLFWGRTKMKWKTQRKKCKEIPPNYPERKEITKYVSKTREKKTNKQI